MSKQKPVSKATEATSEPMVSNPEPLVPTTLISQLREASSVEEALKILQPDAKPKAKEDTVFELNADCQDPLPQKRGLAVLVYITAVRMNAPFKVAEIEAQLPERKSVRYWVRRLATTGHLSTVAH